MIRRIRRILGRVVTYIMLDGGTFLMLVATFYGDHGERANLVGGVGGCVFWLAIIFDRNLKKTRAQVQFTVAQDVAGGEPAG
jgi:hypothetical protein